MIKRFIIAFILLVLVVGGIVGFNIFRDNAIKQYFATMKQPPSTVSTVEVKPMDWAPGIEAIGTVSAVRGVDLTVETTGIVKDIAFHANQKVEAGSLLLQLDDEVERADLDSAKAQAAVDQLALKRAQELQKRGVGSDSTLDNAQAQAAASAAQVAKLQAVLDQKQITAPFAGTAGIPKIDLGQYLAPGTAVVTLQDLDTMRVDFTVPEQQFPMLKIDQPVKIGMSDDDLPFTGKIKGINPKIDPTSRLVSVRAEVANPDGKLTPGQFAQVRVELPKEDGVLAVPQTALTSSLYGDYVFVVEPAKSKDKPAAADEKDAAKPADDSAKPEADAAKPAEGDASKSDLVLSQVFVTTGRHDKDLIEIVKGIKAGDQVVTAGQNRLFNGMSVVVDNTIDPSKPPKEQAARQ
ncbi:efflux RND transporter periplasmic adaptor subunit [Mesorhizobium sp. CN5-321]|uniref:efflux RND transporter periplasmic adaptor subunit n=1 Tax=Mesorhizobium hunchu TaxID=3157708 RepID=UPI0032B7533E